MLYRNTLGLLVHKIGHGYFQGQRMTLFEYVGQEETSGTRIEIDAAFDADHTLVEFKCGVDLYSILHNVLNRGTAAEYAEKIEDELCKAQMRTVDAADALA